MEADDEDGLFTAMRHTWEEIGIDLAETDYMSIGQLDDREITTSLGKRTFVHYFLSKGFLHQLRSPHDSLTVRFFAALAIYTSRGSDTKNEPTLGPTYRPISRAGIGHSPANARATLEYREH